MGKRGRKKGVKSSKPYKVKPRPAITQPNDPTIRYIPLTKGHVAIVDTFLYEWLMEYKWNARWSEGMQQYYAQRPYLMPDGSRTSSQMHREILGFLPGDPRRVDHENRTTLDNRGQNLRRSTQKENMQNSKKCSVNTSGFKGVNALKNGKYRAFLIVDARMVSLGIHDSAEVAARIRDAAALVYFGKFAWLNFPIAP